VPEFGIDGGYSAAIASKPAPTGPYFSAETGVSPLRGYLPYCNAKIASCPALVGAGLLAMAVGQALQHSNPGHKKTTHAGGFFISGIHSPR
jgi:hypothetical protein